MTYKLGQWVEPNPGETAIQALARLEGITGRKSNFLRSYIGIEDRWDGNYLRNGAQAGRVPVLAVHAYKGYGDKTAVRWSDVADGVHDAKIIAGAQAIAQLRTDVGASEPWIIVFHHEPEDDSDEAPVTQGDTIGKCGSRADFRAAAEHFRQVMRGNGLPKAAVLFAVTLTHKTFDVGGPGAYKPAADWMPVKYNLVGVDGYTRYPKGELRLGSQSFAQLFGDAYAYAYANAQSRPAGSPQLFVEECGVIEADGTSGTPVDPDLKANWFRGARDTLASWPNVYGVEYSNVMGEFAGQQMAYHIDSSPASLQGFKDWQGDPNVQ